MIGCRRTLAKAGVLQAIPSYLRSACARCLIAGLRLTAAPLHYTKDGLDQAAQASNRYSLSRQEASFLRDLSARIYRYFDEQSNPRTGLVLDRTRNNGSPHGAPTPASIAATGFGLTALCLAPGSAGLSENAAVDKVRIALRFFAREAPQVHGWFYHFMDPETGARRLQCEVSSIDTALLLAGVLTARARFPGDEEVGIWPRPSMNGWIFPGC